jgi:hypothetical protein
MLQKKYCNNATDARCKMQDGGVNNRLLRRILKESLDGWMEENESSPHKLGFTSN